VSVLDLESHLKTVVDHYDPANDHLTYHESKNELDRIQGLLTDAYSRLLSRQQEDKPRSTPVGVGSAKIGKKVKTGYNV
jgi:hypothetical protein